MSLISSKNKSKKNKSIKEARKADAMALAELIYDIYKEKELKKVLK